MIKKSYVENKNIFISRLDQNDSNINIEKDQNFSDNSKQYEESEFIELRMIGIGSSFTVYLFYHIEQETLFAVKKFDISNREMSKLVEREIANYKQITNHQFLPKLYGTIKDKKYPIIDYIDGIPLTSIKQFNFRYQEQITIIFELLLILNYLHKNNFVYRDLKPSNVMIGANGYAYIIDFDSN